MSFTKFMSSWIGRLVRIAAGILLVWLGLGVVHGIGGWILAIVGLLPLVAGLANFCVFAPIFGGPLLGRDVR